MSQAIVCFLLMVILKNSCVRLVDLRDELCQHVEYLKLYLKIIVPGGQTCFHGAVKETSAKYLDTALFQNNYKYQEKKGRFLFSY